MMPMQPQPAGLPSGSFGLSQRRSRARWRQALLAQAHRPALLAGCAALALTALWWAAMVAARAAGLPLPWVVAPGSAHALAIAWGVLPPMAVALLVASGPWHGVPGAALPAAPARHTALPVALMSAGLLALLAGLHLSRPLAALGLATAAVGLALALGLWGLMALEAGRLRQAPVALALGGGLVMVVCQWASALLLALGQDAGTRAAVAAGLWGGALPLLLALSVPRLAAAGRPAPAPTRRADARPADAPAEAAAVVQAIRQATRAEAGPAPGRTLLLTLVALAWLRAPLAVIEAQDGVGPVALGLLNLAGLPLLPAGVLLLAWLLHGAGPAAPGGRLVRMLRLSLGWLAVALLLQGSAHALALAGEGLGRVAGPWALARAAEHAVAMGAVGGLVLTLATVLVRGAAGRPLQPDNWTWLVVLVLQVATLARVMALLWPTAGLPLSLLAVQFWLGALGLWAVRHGRWQWRSAPRAD